MCGDFTDRLVMSFYRLGMTALHIKKRMNYVKRRRTDAEAEFSPDDFESFQSYYLKKQENRIESNDTAGKNIDDQEKARRVGQKYLDFLVSRGLQPEDTVVDWGCGSLRVGRELIRYLNQDRYYGVDISELFIEKGKTYVGKDLLRQKRPYLQPINEESLGDLTDVEIDYVISTSVLFHVPPDGIDEFLSSILSVMSNQSIAYLHFWDSAILLKVDDKTWAYPYRYLRQRIVDQGGTATLVHFDGSRSSDKMIEMTRCQGDEE